MKRVFLVVWLGMGCLGGPSFAAKPAVTVPTRGDVVVEVLPAGYASASRAARQSARSVDLATVQSLLAAARRTGDARVAIRAEALLGQLAPSARSSADGLVIAAQLAQYRHDFPAALALLGRALDAEPLNVAARATRAQVHLVQGRIADARRDCASLLVRDTAAGSVCVAAIAMRTGRWSDARALLERSLAEPRLDPELRRHLLVMRAEVASRDSRSAEPWFEQALAVAPGDVRTLSAFAAHLQRRGKPAAVRRLLAGRASTETLQLHEALAAHAAKDRDAVALSDALARRYALSRRLGAEPELRDEAELHLLRGDGAAALRVARRNFEMQRDYEDVDILIRAARANNNRAVLGEVAKWAKREGVPLDGVS